MSMVTTCPRCRLQVSIPPDIGQDALVQCPLCQAEYTMGEALEMVPPDLIVLDAGVAAMAGDAADVLGSSVSTSQLPEVEFPDQSQVGGGLPYFADEEEKADERVSLGEEAAESAEEGGAMVGFDSSGPLDGRAQSGSSGFSFDFSDEDEEYEGSVGRDATARQRRQPNMLAEMIKIALGGVVGLAIAYYILLWMGRDPFEIADKLPTWLLPSAMRMP